MATLLASQAIYSYSNSPFRFRVRMQSMDVSTKVKGQKTINMVSTSEIVSTMSLVKKNPEEKISVFADDSFRWADENYGTWQRSIDVWSCVILLQIRLMFNDAKWTYVGGFTQDKQKYRMRQTASWLRKRVLELGPTFIKLGQLYSSRADLFPTEFVEELSKLQDKVPAFSPVKARVLIESELGGCIDELFRVFDDKPIAAASLGQVHRAILHSGEKVVVKVQRPGLKKLFDIDLRNLKLVAEYFQKNDKFGGPIKDWVGIYEECKRILYEEIDYINEGKNAERFRRDFRNIKWIIVPIVYWDYTTTKVLTLEYLPGIKINEFNRIDQHGLNRRKISSQIVEAYLIQMFKTGFFHADPHPGNIAVDMNESIIYYDFGMMGEIDSQTRNKLFKLFCSVYEKDVRKIIQSLIDLETLDSTGDKSSVRRAIQYFLENSLKSLDREKMLTTIGEDLLTLAHDQPFRFPSTFAFCLRAFSTMEGNIYLLDPNFSLTTVAAPYAQSLFNSKEMLGTQFVEQIRKQTNDVREHTMSMPYRVQRVDEFVQQLESGEIKLHVRVLESERAARKTHSIQFAMIYGIFGIEMVNLGVISLVAQLSEVIVLSCFICAGVFFLLMLGTIQRIKKLDEFEKMI